MVSSSMLSLPFCVVGLLAFSLLIQSVAANSRELECLATLSRNQILNDPILSAVNSQQKSWAFPSNSWTFLPSVVSSPNGCIVPNETFVSATRNASNQADQLQPVKIDSLTLHPLPISQIVSTSSLEPFTYIIDSNQAQLELAISYSPLIIKPDTGVWCKLTFFDESKRQIFSDESTTFNGIVALGALSAQGSSLPTKTDFPPLLIPRTTRTIKMDVFASSDMQVCISGVKASVGQINEKSELTKIVREYWNYFAVATLANAAVVPFILFGLGKELGRRVAIPFNILQRVQNRTIPFVLFVATASFLVLTAVSLFTTPTPLSPILLPVLGTTPELRVLVDLLCLVIVLIAGPLLYWPLWLCYDQSFRVVGGLLGTWTTICLGGFRILSFLQSVPVSTPSLLIIQCLVYFPEIFSLFFLFVFFNLSWVFDLTRRHMQKKRPLNDAIEKILEWSYVQDLVLSRRIKKQRRKEERLRKRMNALHVGENANAANDSMRNWWVPRRLEDWMEVLGVLAGSKKGVRLPTLLIAMLILKCLLLYFSGLAILYQYYQSLGTTLTCSIISYLPSSTMPSTSQLSDPTTLWYCLLTCIAVSIIFATLVSGWLSLSVIRIFQKDLKRLRKGDYDWINLPGRMGTLTRVIHRHVNLNGHIKFLGYATTYTLLGSLVILLLSFLFTILVILIILYPTATGIVQIFTRGYLIPLAAVLVIYYIQSFVVSKLFIVPGSRFFVKKRNLFWHVAYLCMWWDLGIVAAGSYVWRTVLAVVGVIGGSLNTEESVVGRGWQKLDGGYTSYLSFLLTEHIYNNPIIIVFLQLLHQSKLKKLNSVYVVPILNRKPMLPAKVEENHSLAKGSSDRVDDDITIVEGRTDQNSEDTDEIGTVSPSSEPSDPIRSKEKATKSKSLSISISTATPDVSDSYNRYLISIRARTRWHLSRTLLKNPELRWLRKHRLSDLAFLNGYEDVRASRPMTLMLPSQVTLNRYSFIGGGGERYRASWVNLGSVSAFGEAGKSSRLSMAGNRRNRVSMAYVVDGSEDEYDYDEGSEGTSSRSGTGSEEVDESDSEYDDEYDGETSSSDEYIPSRHSSNSSTSVYNPAATPTRSAFRKSSLSVAHPTNTNSENKSSQSSDAPISFIPSSSAPRRSVVFDETKILPSRQLRKRTASASSGDFKRPVSAAGVSTIKQSRPSSMYSAMEARSTKAMSALSSMGIVPPPIPPIPPVPLIPSYSHKRRGSRSSKSSRTSRDGKRSSMSSSFFEKEEFTNWSEWMSQNETRSRSGSVSGSTSPSASASGTGSGLGLNSGLRVAGNRLSGIFKERRKSTISLKSNSGNASGHADAKDQKAKRKSVVSVRSFVWDDDEDDEDEISETEDETEGSEGDSESDDDFKTVENEGRE